MQQTTFKRIFLILVFLCLSVRAIGQGKPAAQFSMNVLECLGQDCGSPMAPISWTISDGEGLGHDPQGNNWRLTLEHLDSKMIAVRSRGTTGANRNISILYMGRIDGQQVKGVALSSEGKVNVQLGVVAWQGVVTQGTLSTVRPVTTGDALNYPFTLHECEGRPCSYGDAEYRIAWTFATRIGQGWLNDSPRPMVVDDLSPGFLLVRRAEPGLTAFYFGEIKGKHINGGVLYYDSGNLDQPRFDMWFGQVQDSFTPLQAMNEPDTQVATPVKDPVPPNRMLLCTTGFCMTLTLDGDHYTGIYDGMADHPRNLTIKKWDGRSFLLVRNSSADGKTKEIQYSASIAASGGHTRSGTVLNGGADPEPFSALWTNFRNTDGHARRSRMYPNIELPSGAAEKYAAYPAQIRLVLMAGSESITKADLLQPCTQARLVTDGDTAVEIARFAYRADELSRGNCWTARSAALNNSTGETLAALGLITGWSGKVDSTAGCRQLQAIGNRDAEALLLLSSCYRGFFDGADDFPKDEQKASQIDDLLNNKAPRLMARLRSDDLDFLKERERQKVIDDPPMKREHTFTGDRTSGTCQQDYSCRVYGDNPTREVVDEEELQRLLRDIDDRYARMP